MSAKTYLNLFVDARYEKVRVGHWVVSQRVLIVSAVREDGFREILTVDVADTESEATYQELFRSLKARGLKGAELVTSDDYPGLKVAIARYFQGASWQHCQVHYARNLTKLVPRAKRKELAAGLRGVFAAPTRNRPLPSRLMTMTIGPPRRSRPLRLPGVLLPKVKPKATTITFGFGAPSLLRAATSAGGRSSWRSPRRPGWTCGASSATSPARRPGERCSRNAVSAGSATGYAARRP